MAFFGNCGRYHPAFDYLEPSVSGFLNPLESDAAFQARQEAVGSAPIYAFNSYAGSLRMYGPGELAGAEYVETACRRALACGGRYIVLGSGRGRSVPEGWSRSRAEDGMLAYLKMVGDVCASYNLVACIEPLGRKETDLINTVVEGAAMARALNHPFVKLLADQFHMDNNGESYDTIVDAADLLVHAHTALAPERLTPRAGDRLPAFFAALKAAGYNGGISVEANIWSDDFDGEAVRVAAYMRETWEQAR